MSEAMTVILQSKLRKSQVDSLCEVFNNINGYAKDLGAVKERIERETNKGFAVIKTLRTIEAFSPDPAVTELKEQSYDDLVDIFNNIGAAARASDNFFRSILEIKTAEGYEAIKMLGRIDALAAPSA